MKSTRRAPWLALLVVVGTFVGAAAVAEDPVRRTPQRLEIERSPHLDLRIDGELDEAAWREALRVSIDHEWFPGDGVSPPVQTEALVLFDDTHLYVGFLAQDPRPEEIRAHLMDRDEEDTFVQDDYVSFALDTFNDQRRAFLFRVNPMGVQMDAVYNQLEDTTDFTWDVIWESAAKITGDGYSVEAAIPFNQLRFPRQATSQVWGFEAGRSYPRSVRHRMRSYFFDRDDSCRLCQIPEIAGFEGVEPGLNLEVVPTLTVARTDELGFTGELEDGEEESDAGLTVRWGITPELTLGATIQPDFSQVEADAAQLDVNERFALFFPERRPFFLEGADIFDTGIDALFTRTIADPEWGLKLTGKVGSNALGVFAAVDQVNNILLPGVERSIFTGLDGDVDNLTARYRRDVGRSSTVGALYVGREGDEYHNRVAGMDALFRVGSHSLQVQGLFSQTEYPDEFAASFGQEQGEFGGHAVEGIYLYGNREWNGFLGYRDFGDGFRADAGFVPRVGFDTWRGSLSRSFWGDEGDWLTRTRVGGLGIYTRDEDGELSDQTYEIFANVLGPKQSFLELTARTVDQALDGQLFENLTSLQLDFEMRPSGAAELGLVVSVGETVDAFNARQADEVLIQPSLELKLGDHVNAQLEYERQELEVEEGRLVTAELSQLQLVYQHNVRTFVRGIFQYLDVERNQDLYRVGPPPDQERLFGQLLFSYKINPQTVLFLGTTDEKLAQDGEDLERSSRTFFFKVGYAWLR
ncbi:MAG: DUF5916 domain-containing protein [Acidobacteriota bacterium]